MLLVVVLVVLIALLYAIVMNLVRSRRKTRLSKESKYILARYNKLPAEFRTVDIVPTLVAYDVNAGGMRAVNNHFYANRMKYSTRYCTPEKHICYGSRPFPEHRAILGKVESLEVEAKKREKAMRDLANRSGMDNAMLVLDRLDEEIRISGTVTKELKDSL